MVGQPVTHFFTLLSIETSSKSIVEMRYFQKAILELDYDQYKLVWERKALHERRIFLFFHAPHLQVLNWEDPSCKQKLGRIIWAWRESYNRFVRGIVESLDPAQ